MSLLSGFLSRFKSTDANSNMKVVRILRSIPIQGVIYKADELVLIDSDLLPEAAEDAFDDSEKVIEMRLSEGAEVIEHGKEKAEAKSSTAADDEGEIVD